MNEVWLLTFAHSKTCYRLNLSACINSGPHCKDQHNNKCKIDNFYYPEKSATAAPLNKPVSVVI